MAAPTTAHDEFREQAALYVIGALPEAERAAFEAHASGCAECAAELRSFLPVVSALAQSVPQVDPPPSLRSRVLGARVQPGPTRTSEVRGARPRRSPAAWLSAAALLAITVGLGAYAVSLRNRVDGLESRLRGALVRLDTAEQEAVAARRLVASTQTPIAVLTAPDVKRIDLSGQASAPQAAARAFWSRSRGLVLTASRLPAPPAGQTYQLWVVTAQSPISAGLLKPDSNGDITAAFETPSTIPEPVAMAVTLEREGGVASPMGERYLVGMAQ
jgi:anti-sigma-K factor RskA